VHVNVTPPSPRQDIDLIPISSELLLSKLPTPNRDLDIGRILAEPAASPEAIANIQSAVSKLKTALDALQVKNEESPITSFPEIKIGGQ